MTQNQGYVVFKLSKKTCTSFSASRIDVLLFLICLLQLEDVLRSLEEIRANLSPFQCFLSSKCVRAIRSGERIQEIEGRILSQRTVDTFRNLSMLTRKQNHDVFVLVLSCFPNVRLQACAKS